MGRQLGLEAIDPVNTTVMATAMEGEADAHTTIRARHCANTAFYQGLLGIGTRFVV